MNRFPTQPKIFQTRQNKQSNHQSQHSYMPFSRYEWIKYLNNKKRDSKKVFISFSIPKEMSSKSLKESRTQLPNILRTTKNSMQLQFKRPILKLHQISKSGGLSKELTSKELDTSLSQWQIRKDRSFY